MRVWHSKALLSLHSQLTITWGSLWPETFVEQLHKFYGDREAQSLGIQWCIICPLFKKKDYCRRKPITMNKNRKCWRHSTDQINVVLALQIHDPSSNWKRENKLIFSSKKDEYFRENLSKRTASNKLTWQSDLN